MVNQNYENINSANSDNIEDKVVLIPEIVLGKMRINLENLEAKEKIVIDSHKIPGEFNIEGRIEIDIREFTGDLSGYFEVEKTDEDKLSIVLKDRDGEEVFKREMVGTKIILKGDPKEHLDIKINPSRIDIEKEDLGPDIDINEEDLN